MRLFDSHTHLNTADLHPQRQDYLLQFVRVWWAGLVNSWASEEYNIKGIEISKAVERLRDWEVESGKWQNILVKSTVGYHPWCCDDGEITESNLQQKMIYLERLYEDNKDTIVAIGECGIDTYYPGSEHSLSLQKQLFTLQCALAQKLNIPLMVHIRKDFLSAFEILKDYRDMTIYVHCRWFGPEEVERLRIESWTLNWKLFIWFCGNITYKNAQNLRESLAKVPLDQLLLETDAPRLSPQVVRGTVNHPANVKYIYEFVAEYLKIDTEQLALQIEKNFKEVYGI